MLAAAEDPLVVNSRDEAEAIMAFVSTCTLQLNEAVNDQNTKLLAAREDDEKIRELTKRLNRFVTALELWASLNPKEFDESRSLILRRGKISLRNKPPSVAFGKGWTEDLVLSKLRKIKLWAARYIRIKETLNKQQILADIRPESESAPESLIGKEDRLKKIGIVIERGLTVKIEPKLEPIPTA